MNKTSTAIINKRKTYTPSIIDRIKRESDATQPSSVRVVKNEGEKKPFESSMFDINFQSPRSSNDVTFKAVCDEDRDTKLPCEFCETPISIYKLIRHQTECTRNIDSLYFNSGGNDGVLPQVATEAMLSNRQNKGSEEKEIDRIPVARLLDFEDITPPPLPPKNRTRLLPALTSDLNTASTGARPKHSSGGGSSIVGRYVDENETRIRRPKKYPAPQLPTLPMGGSRKYSLPESPCSSEEDKKFSVKPKKKERKISLDPGIVFNEAGESNFDNREREKLREMLSGLRKDPFDEDLENNDGSFFPCEFCGDPYPVEFIMRHQVILI